VDDFRRENLHRRTTWRSVPLLTQLGCVNAVHGVQEQTSVPQQFVIPRYIGLFVEQLPCVDLHELLHTELVAGRINIA